MLDQDGERNALEEVVDCIDSGFFFCCDQEVGINTDSERDVDIRRLCKSSTEKKKKTLLFQPHYIINAQKLAGFAITNRHSDRIFFTSLV